MRNQRCNADISKHININKPFISKPTFHLSTWMQEYPGISEVSRPQTQTPINPSLFTIPKKNVSRSFPLRFHSKFPNRPWIDRRYNRNATSLRNGWNKMVALKLDASTKRTNDAIRFPWISFAGLPMRITTTKTTSFWLPTNCREPSSFALTPISTDTACVPCRRGDERRRLRFREARKTSNCVALPDKIR